MAYMSTNANFAFIISMFLSNIDGGGDGGGGGAYDDRRRRTWRRGY